MTLVPIGILINFILSKFLTRFIDLENKFFNILYAFIIGFVILFSKITGFEIGSYFGLNIVSESWLKIIALVLLCTNLITEDGLLNGRKLLASLVFIFSPSLEFLILSFLIFYILEALEVTKTPRDLVKYFPIVLLLFLFSGGEYGQVLSSVGLVLFYLMRLNSKEVENGFYHSFVFTCFFSSLLIFIKIPPVVVTIMISIVFIDTIRFLKDMVSRNQGCVDDILCLIQKLIILLPIFGDRNIFYLMLSFLLIVKTLLSFSGDSKNLSWFLFIFLFLFSPPFGLGYIFKTNLYRAAFSFGILEFWSVVLMTTLVTIFTTTLFIKNISPYWEQVKNKEYNFSRLAFVAIGINILISVLFIPSEWNIGLGALFSKLVGSSLTYSSLSSLGYYLFWIEVVFGVLCTILVFKVGYTKIGELMARISTKRVNFSRRGMPKRNSKVNFSKSELKELIDVFNPAIESLTDHNLIIFLVFLLSLLVMGAS